MTVPFAHGLGGYLDLPVPSWLFAYGAAIVLIVSFAALWLLWSRPRLDSMRRGHPLPVGLQRVVLSPALRILLGAIGFGLFLVVWLAALIGERSANDNLAPLVVYVLFWLGVAALTVVFGNVWAALNPWRAFADFIAWASRRAGLAWEAPFVYPRRLGRWPAAALLFCFAALELAYFDPADPRALGFAIFVYSASVWLGMLAFGRREWLESGDAFGVYFDFLARLAPFGTRVEHGERVVVVRPPVICASIDDPRPGTVAFVAVMLGSVAFDGFSRSSFWTDARYDLITSFASGSPGLADLIFTLLNVVGLALVVGVVAGAYLLAVRAAEEISQRRGLANAFLGSLLPIALAYLVAHYFSFFVIQAQSIVGLASDPFNRGWDLFGSAGFRAEIGLLSPNTIWYVQVGALVLGHVAGLMIAHDRSLTLVPSRVLATRAQLPFLGLMVLYTVGGLWVLSAG